MKKIILLGLSILLITSGILLSNQSIEGKIIAALKKGKVEDLSTFFNEETTLILTEENVVVIGRKAVAEKLNDLFENNIPKKFELKHSGKSKGKSSSFIIGNLYFQSESYEINIMIFEENIEEIELLKLEQNTPLTL